jgi:hypothetical protein
MLPLMNLQPLVALLSFICTEELNRASGGRYSRSLPEVRVSEKGRKTWIIMATTGIPAEGKFANGRSVREWLRGGSLMDGGHLPFLNGRPIREHLLSARCPVH